METYMANAGQPLRIFLAGGFHGGWQQQVKECVPQHIYYDPASDTDQRYIFNLTAQNFKAIDESDMVFAYFEENDPSGIGLALEVGYAVRAGKRVIIVDEHTNIHGMLAACGEMLFVDLRTAIEYLQLHTKFKEE